MIFSFRKQVTVVQNTPVLDSLRIASPCPASWEKMDGDDRVRFCGECQLNVYNLSAMSRMEAETLVREREGRLCVRFYRRTDGTMITQDCPRRFRAVVHRVSRIAGAVFSALLAMTPAAAQTTRFQGDPIPAHDPQAPLQGAPLPPDKATESNQPNQMSAKVRVLVTDLSGGVLPSAKITLASRKQKTPLLQTTDNNGAANFSTVPAGVYKMIVDCHYFKTFSRTLKIEASRNQDLVIHLRISNANEAILVGVIADEPLTHKDSSTTQTTFTPTTMGRIATRPAPLK